MRQFLGPTGASHVFHGNTCRIWGGGDWGLVKITIVMGWNGPLGVQVLTLETFWGSWWTCAEVILYPGHILKASNMVFDLIN